MHELNHHARKRAIKCISIDVQLLLVNFPAHERHFVKITTYLKKFLSRPSYTKSLLQPDCYRPPAAGDAHRSTELLEISFTEDVKEKLPNSAVVHRIRMAGREGFKNLGNLLSSNLAERQIITPQKLRSFQRGISSRPF